MFIGGVSGIFHAHMDGTDFTKLGDGGVAGITVDSNSDRVFWAYYGANRIMSSFRNGSGADAIFQLDSGTEPWGLTKLDDLIYWGGFGDYTLQSSTTTGEEMITLYYGTSRIHQLTFVPMQEDLNELRNFEKVDNPCEERGCSHICVLSAKSFRCVCPAGLHLAEDQKSCMV